MIRRPPFFGGFDNEFKIAKIDAFNKKVNYSYFIILLNYLIQRFGEKYALGSVFSLYELHK